MYRLATTILVIVCLLGVYSCAPAQYNRATPAVKTPPPPVNVGCGLYYPSHSKPVPWLKAEFENGKVFSLDSIRTNVVIAFFGTSNQHEDKTYIDQIIYSLKQFSKVKSTLWVFNTPSDGQTSQTYKNCTVIWQPKAANLAENLEITKYPAVVYLDAQHKEVRWIAQGDNPNLALDLPLSMIEEHKEPEIKTGLDKVLEGFTIMVGIAALIVGICIAATIENNKESLQ